MTGNPIISVIICTYNRASYITGALESLHQQMIDRASFEIIVVNNNSTDDTEAVCKAYIAAHPDMPITYLTEQEQGASAARNTGAANAKGGLYCFMDDDAVAEKDYLQLIISFFEQHPYAGGLGGRIIPRYIPEEPEWMSLYVSSMVGNFDYSKEVVEFGEGKYPLESNMIVPASAFHEVGGFNTAIPGVKGTLRIGGEGKEFFLKLRAKGYRIFYHPQIIVHHVVEVEKLTPAYLYRVASGYGRGERVRTLQISRMAYLKKIIEYLFKLGAAMILALGHVLQATPQKAWPLIRFRIDALKGLFNY